MKKLIQYNRLKNSNGPNSLQIKILDSRIPNLQSDPFTSSELSGDRDAAGTDTLRLTFPVSMFLAGGLFLHVRLVDG